jgi:hypothetical protein
MQIYCNKADDTIQLPAVAIKLVKYSLTSPKNHVLNHSYKLNINVTYILRHFVCDLFK